MGWPVVIVGGAGVGVLATVDALWWHSPSMPGWSLPLLGAIFAAGLIVAEVLDR